MSRHAQPVEIADLKGATRKNPQRYTKTPPKSEFPIGNAPPHLDAAAKAVWFELETYAAKGVLTGGDRLVMETTCVLVAQFRADPEGFQAAKMGHMIGCLARLGLTPADRQKLDVKRPGEENAFNQF